LEAGIHIPEELPYSEQSRRDEAAIVVSGEEVVDSGAPKRVAANLKDKVRRLSVMAGIKASSASGSPGVTRKRSVVQRRESSSPRRTAREIPVYGDHVI